MNAIEKYQGQQVVPSLAHFEDVSNSSNAANASLIVLLLRRWRIVLLTFFIISAVGIPTVWLTVKPSYQAIAAIRITPVIPSILFGGENAIPMYKNFMYTQADLITSNNVLQRVADDLVDKDPMFFKKPDSIITKLTGRFSHQYPADPVAILRGLLNSTNLSVTPESNTELIKIKMRSSNPKKAVQVVNSFIRAYMAIVVSDEARSEDQKLTILENEHRILSNKLERQRQMIREMAKEYGTHSLDGRQEMMLQRVAALQSKLTEFEMQKINLKVQMQLLDNKQEQKIEPEQLFRLRYDFTNADLMVQTLTANIAQLDQSLIVARQQLAPTNPELDRKEALLETLNQRLNKRQEEVGKNFDEMVANELAKNDKNQLGSIKVQLKQITAHEKHLQEMLSKEDSETIELGRKQLAIQDLQDQLNLTKDIYETVRRRIQQLEMERKRPARVSEAYYANAAPFQNERMKYTIALIFGAMAAGVGLALLRNKLDLCLHTPNDVLKSAGVQVVGTITRSADIKKPLLFQQIANDYQTICANLGLFNTEDIPRKLVITSPGSEEGKTTLAINLAINIVKTGKRVLLIDGDLRKPDIARLLNLSRKGNWLREMLLGKKFEEVVCSTFLARLDVLTACSSRPSDTFKLIARQRTAKIINLISQRYDLVIIDSPPVLAVPDALLWAKMADAVVVTSFADHTEGPELRETLNRFALINVKVLGTVLNNVSLNYSYNSYGYGYCTGAASGRSRRTKRRRNAVLLPMQEQHAGVKKTNS